MYWCVFLLEFAPTSPNFILLAESCWVFTASRTRKNVPQQNLTCLFFFFFQRSEFCQLFCVYFPEIIWVNLAYLTLVQIRLIQDALRGKHINVSLIFTLFKCFSITVCKSNTAWFASYIFDKTKSHQNELDQNVKISEFNLSTGINKRSQYCTFRASTVELHVQLMQTEFW